jgi:hypothetical protein
MEEQVIVTVSGDVEAVAEQLRAAGMTVGQVLGEIGIITGSVDTERRTALAAVDGVVAVEVARDVQIAPPPAEPPSQDSEDG